MSTTRNSVIRILSCCVKSIQGWDRLVRIHLSFLRVVWELGWMEDPMVLKLLLLRLLLAIVLYWVYWSPRFFFVFLLDKSFHLQRTGNAISLVWGPQPHTIQRFQKALSIVIKKTTWQVPFRWLCFYPESYQQLSLSIQQSNSRRIHFKFWLCDKIRQRLRLQCYFYRLRP